jgi:hypothetical protein
MSLQVVPFNLLDTEKFENRSRRQTIFSTRRQIRPLMATHSGTISKGFSVRLLCIPHPVQQVHDYSYTGSNSGFSAPLESPF